MIPYPNGQCPESRRNYEPAALAAATKNPPFQRFRFKGLQNQRNLGFI